jgi:hypothetical protein
MAMTEPAMREGDDDVARASEPRITTPSTSAPPVAPGKRTLTDGLRAPVALELAPDVAAAAPSATAPSATAPTPRLAQDALQRATDIIDQLLPAYRTAVDRLRGDAALELGLAAVENYRALQAARDQLQPEPSLSSASADVGLLDSMVVAIEQALAWQLGPQTFHGHSVINGAHGVTLGRRAGRADQLAAEVVQVASLLSAVAQVVALLPDEAEHLYSARVEPDVAAQVAELVEPWRARPVAFAFLRAALGAAGANVWRTVENLPSQRKLGRTLADVHADVQVQAAETGPLAAVGDFDSDQVAGAVVPGGIDKAGANEVWAMLPTVAPDALGAVVVHLSKTGRLEAVLGPEVRPRADVQALHDAIPFDGRATGREARRLLRPILEAPLKHALPLVGEYEAHAGGKSNTRRLDEAIDDSDSPLARGGLRATRFGYHALTGGFAAEHDAAYDQLQDGTLTAGEFQGAKESAFYKASAVTGVSYLTGGVLGAYGAGFGRAFGPRIAALAEGVLGGFGGGVGGAMAADAYDVASGAMDWGDISLADWGTAGIYGAAIGAGFAATSVLSAEAARLLPGGKVTAAQQYGARFPQHADVFNRMRLLGAREGSVLRLRVAKLRQLLADVFPPGGGGPALQFVGGGVADDALVAVRIQATRPLNLPLSPGALNGPAPLAILEARRLDDELLDHDPVDVVDEFERNGSRRPRFEDEVDEVADDLVGEADQSVREGELPPRYRDLGDAHEGGLTVRGRSDAKQSGIVPDEGALNTEQHHVFPKEGKHAEFFRKRGLDENRIHDYTIDIDEHVHELIHVGRDVWEQEWSAAIINRILRSEKDLGRLLTVDEMIAQARLLMAARGIDPNKPFRRWNGAPKTKAPPAKHRRAHR